MKRSILMLEHDDDDRYITQAVFEEKQYPIKIDFVHSSDDLFAFLLSSELNSLSYPAVILLNHSAAPAGALEILRRLRSNHKYASIPVVVLAGSLTGNLIRQCYTAGANSVIKKPDSSNGIYQ